MLLKVVNFVGSKATFFVSWGTVFYIFFFMLQVFRHLLNIQVEFSAEEFETALITPNDTLGDIHIPLLKVGALIFLVYFYLIELLVSRLQFVQLAFQQCTLLRSLILLLGAKEVS